ncbi:MAG: GNAT family acetyltransferase [Lachnospiraceae bacterium]|nr:GNAT family acetyltransferase [Lachnospiraceae bacterium]
MVLRKDLLSIGFYRLSPFHGSDGPLSYRIENFKIEDGVDDKGNPKMKIGGLRVITYPGPYNYENTDDSLKVSKDFPFAPESLDAIVDYLNSLPKPELVP